MATVSVNRVRIGYDEAGDGPVVVFVHGGLLDRRSWDHQFADLASDHRVVRYDHREYGESESGTGDFAYHEDLLAFMDALRIERATLVGNSMGGGHAVQAALVAPDRVERLVLVASGLDGHAWPQTFVEQAIARVRNSVPDERRERYRVGNGTGVPEFEADLAAYVEAHLRWMIAGPDRTEHDLPEGVWVRAKDMFRGYVRRRWTEPGPTEREPAVATEDLLQAVRAPALVVNGLADVPELQVISDLLTDPASGIPGARRLDLPDTAHAPQMERPAEVTAAIRAFLKTTAL
ncbi:alpha/beta fold hydrolase [Glycomyces harbinensis]|uniref:Pimeloyl-ACP methyl ester carboxylesterase n=1 Tax=Glycomyces harbinensis TaxID=58114 RepID=A0A1G6RX47_9ACTN|nr:alpha/beta hydrolase [Glycomyces harbinensis]SDD08506.1 Pimeloyl-ACP methyl ester carboxylesterase [Glycomyces harbinensis]